jgi:hypothetical protein
VARDTLSYRNTPDVIGHISPILDSRPVDDSSDVWVLLWYYSIVVVAEIEFGHDWYQRRHFWLESPKRDTNFWKKTARNSKKRSSLHDNFNRIFLK